MRILSGIQPSGDLHLGNYFAMMKRMIEWQENGDLFCFIVNYHALTSVRDKNILKKGTINAVIDFLALGINPEKSTFWVQSDVSEVTELNWILSTLTPMGLLERCHSYKDKISKGITPNHGVFAYPVLMAADILLFNAEVIPVGKDQKQHVEVARDIAIKFNNTYGETFVVPKPDIPKNIATVPGTDGSKMSKSYGNTISIFCDEKVLKKTVMGIVTDSKAVEDKKEPDQCNVFNILKLFLDDSEIKYWRDRYISGGLGYGEVKKYLFERIWAYFLPYRDRREKISKNIDYIFEVLDTGREKAKKIAVTVLDDVKTKIGLDYRY